MPRKESILNYIIILGSILLSSSPVIPEAARGALIVLLLFFLSASVRGLEREPVKLLVFVLILLSPMTILDLFKTISFGVITLSFLFMPCSLMLGFFVGQRISFDRFEIVFEKIVFILSLIALPLYLAVFFVPSIVSFFPSYTFGGFTHKTIYFLNVLIGDDLVFRNSGFASEPGVYQFYLNLGLFISLRNLPALRLKTFFYIVSIVTTNSTAGLFIMAILLLIYLRGPWRAALIAVSIVFFGVLSGYVAEHWEAKVVNDQAAGGRLDPAINALNVFSENIFGIGAYRYTEIYQEMNLGSSDSYTQIAMRYGALGLMAIFTLIFRLSRRGLGFVTIFLLSFLTNPFFFSPLPAIFYFSKCSPKNSTQ